MKRTVRKTTKSPKTTKRVAPKSTSKIGAKKPVKKATGFRKKERAVKTGNGLTIIIR